MTGRLRHCELSGGRSCRPHPLSHFQKDQVKLAAHSKPSTRAHPSLGQAADRHSKPIFLSRRVCYIFQKVFLKPMGRFMLLGLGLLQLSEAFFKNDGVKQASAPEFVTSIQKLFLSRRCEEASGRKSVPSIQKLFLSRWCEEASSRKSVPSIQKFSLS